MPDVVGDVPGVLDVLTDCRMKRQYSMLTAIFESKVPSKVEHIEEENNVDDALNCF